MFPERKIDGLMTKGYSAIDREDYAEALKIGSQLHEAKFSGAFEVKALALAGMGKKAKAIRVLEEGVRLVPDVWLLWQLLGNYLSDAKKYKQAMAAFEKGLQVERPDKVSLNYNYAVSLDRKGDRKKALSRIDLAMDSREFADVEPKLAHLCYAFAIDCRNKRRHFTEAEKIFERFEKDLRSKVPSEDALSSVYSDAAFALFKLRRSKEARGLLLKAIAADKHNTDAQSLLRTVDDSGSRKGSKYFRVMVHGRWGRTSWWKKPTYFFTTYDVVANDETEALGYIKPFEPEGVRESLKVESVKVLKSPSQPKGVYRTNGYSFYSE